LVRRPARSTGQQEGGSMPTEAAVKTQFPIRGNVTATTVNDLRVEIKKLIDGGARQLVLDLAACEVVDSTGVSLFISIYNTLSGVGGTLELINVSADLRSLFVVMRMHQCFSISGL
jgi:anti-sigma B factor antagonist